LPASILSSFEEDAAIWLVELHRMKAIQKFSGTLIHPCCTDRLGMTLSAYAHFLYEWSGHELVLADIQGATHLLTLDESLLI